MKTIIGIIIGIVVSLAVKTAYADWSRMQEVDRGNRSGAWYQPHVWYDNVSNVNCYSIEGVNGNVAISCLSNK